MLLSEQYRDKGSPSWYANISGLAAIWVRDTVNLPVRAHGRGDGFVEVLCTEVTLSSIYLTLNESLSAFRHKLAGLEDEIRNTEGGVVDGEDFNSRAPKWDLAQPDSRITHILETASRTGLILLSIYSTPTFYYYYP